MSFRQFVDRYGVALGVVAALTLVIALLPGNASDRTVDAGLGDLGTENGELGGAGEGAGDLGTDGEAAAGDAGAGGSGGGGGSEAGGAGGSGGGGQSGDTQGGGGQAQGTPGEVLFGQGPCRPDGRQAGISKYMAQCVKWTGTDNGGSTFRGVTKDKVVIVRWLGQLDEATRAILQGAKLSDEPAVIKRAYQNLFRYSNLHYETFGREVVFVDLPASGPSESDEAMKNDALKIATEIKPFAVIEGNPAAAMPNVLSRELAQRGVLCMCTTSLTSQWYSEVPPVVFSTLPTATEYARNAAEYIGKRLAGKNAVHAGDELNPTQQFKSKKRKFGLIYLEGVRGKVDPEGKRIKDTMVAALRKYGVKFSAQVAYIYDPGRNQNDVTNLISKMKSEGVTTIVPFWDPLYPILITREASKQQYFPEWFVVGTGLSDTSAAGRLYDQLQWRHAFGISPLWVTWERVEDSAGYREYHHGRGPGGRKGEEGVLINIYRARIETLFRGIHMAGPNLTNETFVRGQFAFPKTGGSPALPLFFFNRAFPTEIKDFTEVWYDHDRNGPDERSEQGTGMMMKVDGGKRYLLGQWPRSTPKAFVAAGALAVSRNPAGGGHQPHEQDGHRHPPEQRCLSCK